MHSMRQKKVTTMFGAMLYSVASQAIAEAKARQMQEDAWRKIPKAQFEREMRIREIRALERTANKATIINVRSSIF